MTRYAPRLGSVGVLVLIVGIIGMHSLIVAPSHSTASVAPVGHQVASMHLAEPGAAVVSAAEACDCDGHQGFHACVFVMTGLLGIAGLALLYWVGIAGVDRMQSGIRHALRRRQRAPPWTVLTLAELSLLRI